VSEAPPEAPVLSLRGITRRFPGVLALDGVDFDARAGECHALMGENGAGKSTLLKIVTGALRPDAGSMSLGGTAYEPRSPPDAQRRGVAAVYQEVGLVPGLSVAENLFLARFPRGRVPWLIDRRAVRRRARDLLAQFGQGIDPDSPVAAHPIAVQQMVAIARAMDMDARILVLDEPTSSLGPRETESLFALIGRLKGRGLAVLFVTHFLDQVYRVADRITVLRNGRKVGTFVASELPRIRLVAHMLGREAESGAGGPPAGADAPVAAKAQEAAERPRLRVRGLARRGVVQRLDLTLGRGEVLGLAGLLGSGRTEAARLIFAADRPDAGRVEVDGRAVRIRSPRAAVSRGLAFCPEDRKADALFLSMSVQDNITMVVQRTLSRVGLIRRREHRRVADAFIRRLGIGTPDADRPVGTLSGGNQQKVVLARWLAMNPSVLILDEPTRGVDVGAKAEIERLIAELAGRGVGVLFISSELEEVVRVSDRVLVLRDRRIVGELAGGQVTESAVMSAIAGVPS
jgi:monosaccharide-transporting ATPase